MNSKHSTTFDIETELIREVAAGNQLAFKKVYERYKSKIYTLAISVLRNKEDSEDVLVEVFASLWNNKEKLVRVENLDAFIYTVTRNRALNLFKKRQKLAQNELLLTQDDVFEDMVESAEADLEFKEIQALLLSITSQLPPQQREIFNLIKLQGYKRKEIAEKLNLSENTVRNHLNAAIKAVKKEFEKNHPDLFGLLLWFLL